MLDHFIPEFLFLLPPIGTVESPVVECWKPVKPFNPRIRFLIPGFDNIRHKEVNILHLLLRCKIGGSLLI